jgi:hypothetical protein
MKAQRRRTGIGLLFLYPQGWMGLGGYAMPQLLYSRKRHMVPIVQEAGWALELVLTGRENLAQTRVQPPGPSSL